MSLFPFPFFRKSLPSLGNPVYISDILASNQLTIDGLSAILNLPSLGFAIISGFTYDPGPPEGYGPGIYWLNGFFYNQQNTFVGGQYLAPNLVDVLPKPFSDTNTHNIYTEYLSQATSSPAGATPLFTGNMDQYRIGLQDLKTNLLAAEATIASLGNAAFANIGTLAGNVASATDPRLIGNLAFFDARYAQRINVIEKGTVSGAYVPANPGDPTNKAYVDAISGRRLASGRTNVGEIPTGEITVNISFGVTLADTNYKVMCTLVSLGTPHNDATVFTPAMIDSSKSQTQVSFQLGEGVGIAQNVALDWIVFAN